MQIYIAPNGALFLVHHVSLKLLDLDLRLFKLNRWYICPSRNLFSLFFCFLSSLHLSLLFLFFFIFFSTFVFSAFEKIHFHNLIFQKLHSINPNRDIIHTSHCQSHERNIQPIHLLDKWIKHLCN